MTVGEWLWFGGPVGQGETKDALAKQPLKGRMSKMPNGTCATCGFLTIRHPDTGELVEVPPACRTTWNVKIHHQSKYLVITEAIPPVCFKLALPLAEQGKPDVVIQTQRNCPSFIPWVHGYSPKEHAELLREEELRKATAEQRDRDLKWQEDQNAKRMAWEEVQKEKDRRDKRITQFITWGLSLVTGVLAFFGRELYKWIVG